MILMGKWGLMAAMQWSSLSSCSCEGHWGLTREHFWRKDGHDLDGGALASSGIFVIMRSRLFDNMIDAHFSFCKFYIRQWVNTTDTDLITVIIICLTATFIIRRCFVVRRITIVMTSISCHRVVPTLQFSASGFLQTYCRLFLGTRWRPRIEMKLEGWKRQVFDPLTKV